MYAYVFYVKSILRRTQKKLAMVAASREVAGKIGEYFSLFW